MRPLAEQYWFSQKLTRAPSKVHGLGMFARQNIFRGEKVVEAGGTLMTRDCLPDQGKRPHSWLSIPGSEDQVLYIPTDYPFQATCLNHSCTPNLKFEFPRWIALRSIREGEELFTDYTTLGYPSGMLLLSECHCASPECRGENVIV